MTIDEAMAFLLTVDEWSVNVTPVRASMRVYRRPLRVQARRRKNETTADLIVRGVGRFRTAAQSLEERS